jgi:hypothetical protein
VPWLRILGIVVWAILANILAALLSVELTWQVITLLVVMGAIGDMIYALTEPKKRVNELPELPDDDADFTPDLARKIIAKYREMLARRQL